MEELIEQLAEILDVEAAEIKLENKFTDYDNWDSLAALSIISLADTDYNKSLKRDNLLEFANIGEFVKYLLG